MLKQIEVPDRKESLLDVDGDVLPLSKTTRPTQENLSLNSRGWNVAYSRVYLLPTWLHLTLQTRVTPLQNASICLPMVCLVLTNVGGLQILGVMCSEIIDNYRNFWLVDWHPFAFSSISIPGQDDRRFFLVPNVLPLHGHDILVSILTAIYHSAIHTASLYIISIIPALYIPQVWYLSTCSGFESPPVTFLVADQLNQLQSKDCR